MPVTVLDSAHDLLEELSGLMLGELAVGDNVVEELLSRVLQNHDDLAWRRDDSIQLDDVWVPQELQVLDLSLDTASHISRDQLAPRYDFQSHLLLADLMYSQFHLAE
jgi:hypothetical protein